MSIVDILRAYHASLLSGLFVTFQLAFVAWLVGLPVGALAAWVAWRRSRLFRPITSNLVYIIGSIPILVALFWLHYPLQALLDVNLPPFITAAFTLTLFNTIGVYQIVLGSLTRLPRQYVTAAMVLGIPAQAITFRIVLPLVLRDSLPPLIFQQMVILQSTVFASLISVEELFRVAQRINSIVYRPIEIYSAMALFFLALCLPLTILSVRLRGFFSRDFSER